MRSWEKIKKSGTYWRAVQRERDLILRRARDIRVETRIRRTEVHQIIAQPTVIENNNIPASNVYNEDTSNSTGSDTDIVNNKDDDEFSNDDEFWKEGGNEMERNKKFLTSFKQWAIECQINHLALKRVMKLINTHFGANLPDDPRTMLQTPKTVNISKIDADGQYWHHGIKRSLQCVLQNISELKKISININIDGLPIFDSSKTEFWPILFNITEKPNLPPMVIGIYCGKSKCSNLNAFLTPFVQEMKELMINGIIINSQKITVQLRSIICDSPARAYIKGVANFNGQHGCQKCTTVGEYSDVSNTNIFPRTECEKRTDAKFRQKLYPKHCKFDTPLSDLDIDMVEQFPVGDSLHLFHLGVMKRLLFGWRDGTFRLSDTKWPAKTTIDVSEHLSKFKMPAEFHRKVRGLDCLSHWKGTEYRTFLHYLSIIVLRDHLPHQAYMHFLLLFSAVTICSSKRYFKMLPIARAMLLQFIDIYAEIYGKHHITSNVHNLSHVVDEVERFGELDTFSAYTFENELGKIKRLLRSGSLPLAQVAKRIMEDFNCMMASNNIFNSNLKEADVKKPILSKQNSGENVPDCLLMSKENGYNFYSKVQLKDFMLSTDSANCWFLIKECEIACVTNIIQSHKQPNDVQLCCIEMNIKENFFILPVESRHLNIYSVDCHQLTKKEKKIFSLTDVDCKLVNMPDGNKKIFVPMQHTS